MYAASTVRYWQRGEMHEAWELRDIASDVAYL
jgi:hypothetical protein